MGVSPSKYIVKGGILNFKNKTNEFRKIGGRMEEKQPKFISLMKDLTFKALWILGNDTTKEYLNRIIKNIVGYDVSDFYLGMNELGINNYKSVANKVDILLCSKDNLTKINIELNSEYKSLIINKNDSYIYKLAGEFYADKKDNKKYKDNINVEQINLNGFYNHDKKEIAEMHYTMRDIKYNFVRSGIKIHDIYIPEIRNMCYDNDNEFYKDLAMFMCKSYEEMEELANGNKERKFVMSELKRLGSEKEFVDLYDHDEFEAIIRADIEESNLKKGFEQGHAVGLNEGIEIGEKNAIYALAKKKIDAGMSKEEVAKILEIDVSTL